MRALGLAGTASGSNTSPAHPRHHGSTRTGCATWRSVGPTRSGAPTSLTSAWHAALPIWWRSSTGTPGGCSAGASATPWRRCSAWTVYRTLCAFTANLKCSTPTRVRSSPATLSRVRSTARASSSTWTAEVERLTCIFCQAALAQRQARGHAPQGLGGAMIVAKYGAAQGRSMALRSTGTQFDEVRLEKPEIRNAKKSGQRRPAVCLIGCNLN